MEGQLAVPETRSLGGVETLTLAHVLSGCAALFAGLAVLVAPKGTRLHKLLGRAYAVLMFTVSATAFMLYPEGRLSVFHGVAALSAALVAGAVFVAPSRRGRSLSTRRPLIWHARLMLYSYTVLVGTTLSQFWDHLPLTPAWRAVLFLQLPAVVAWVAVERRALPVWTSQPTASPELDVRGSGRGTP